MNLVTSYWLWTIKNILVSVIRKKIDGVNHTKYDDTSDQLQPEFRKVVWSIWLICSRLAKCYYALMNDFIK